MNPPLPSSDHDSGIAAAGIVFAAALGMLGVARGLVFPGAFPEVSPPNPVGGILGAFLLVGAPLSAGVWLGKGRAQQAALVGLLGMGAVWLSTGPLLLIPDLVKPLLAALTATADSTAHSSDWVHACLASMQGLISRPAVGLPIALVVGAGLGWTGAEFSPYTRPAAATADPVVRSVAASVGFASAQVLMGLKLTSLTDVTARMSVLSEQLPPSVTVGFWSLTLFSSAGLAGIAAANLAHSHRSGHTGWARIGAAGCVLLWLLTAGASLFIRPSPLVVLAHLAAPVTAVVGLGLARRHHQTEALAAPSAVAAGAWTIVALLWADAWASSIGLSVVHGILPLLPMNQTEPTQPVTLNLTVWNGMYDYTMVLLVSCMLIGLVVTATLSISLRDPNPEESPAA